MARTPSENPRALEARLGHPSAIKVTSDNRRDFRKWACAIGFPSSVVSTWPAATLASMYALHFGGTAPGTTPRPAPAAPKVKPAMVPAIPTQSTSAPAALPVPPAIPVPPVAPVAPAAAPQPVAAPLPRPPVPAPIAGDEASALAALRALLASPAAPVDEATVRAIVADAMKDVAPGAPSVLEIRIADRVGHVDGLMHSCVPDVLLVLANGGHAMLVGPAGCGKTTVAEQAAQALELPFYITGAVGGAHELLGFVDGHGNYQSTPFRKAFETGGVMCLDELDAGDAAAILVINSAIANGVMGFPDSEAPIKRHADFKLVCTANTFGKGADRVYVGRSALDAATLDRFAVFDVDYSDEIETYLSGGRTDWLEYVRSIRKGARAANIRHVVSTRAVAMGARMLAAGMAWDRVADLYLWKGLNEADKKRCAGL